VCRNWVRQSTFSNAEVLEKDDTPEKGESNHVHRAELDAHEPDIVPHLLLDSLQRLPVHTVVVINITNFIA
jgi:hypothetical protein